MNTDEQIEVCDAIFDMVLNCRDKSEVMSDAIANVMDSVDWGSLTMADAIKQHLNPLAQYEGTLDDLQNHKEKVFDLVDIWFQNLVKTDVQAKFQEAAPDILHSAKLAFVSVVLSGMRSVEDGVLSYLDGDVKCMMIQETSRYLDFGEITDPPMPEDW